MLMKKAMMKQTLAKGFVQRFGGLQWRGLLALNFMRRTELPPCTNVSAKHGTPAIANPMLAVRASVIGIFCSQYFNVRI